ncbi:hypothetical protein HYY69_00930 [Candidatus Woesearchaeota archaeon]|nr:hypothetical protein [Candidatus Woesearchaeota archaeon]
MPEEVNHGRRIVVGGLAAVLGELLLLHANRTPIETFLEQAEDLLCDASETLERRSTYTSTDRLAEVLRQQGVNPVVRNYGGDRTLLVIGEPLGIHNQEYPHFFNALRPRVAISRLFMESAYAQASRHTRIITREPFEDPYFTRQRDVFEILTGKRMTYADAYCKLDFHGYVSLSGEYIIHGIDDRVLCRDAVLLTKLQDAILKLSTVPNSDQQFKDHVHGYIKALPFQLSQQLGLYSGVNEGYDPSLSPIDLVSQVADLALTASVRLRNQYFAQVLHELLKFYEVGALIINDANMDARSAIQRVQEKIPGINLDPENYGSLHDYLAAAKIDTVYLPFSEVKRMVG